MKVVPISTARNYSGIAACKQMGRLHLPVAPRANYRIRFSSTEKSPLAMMPEEALVWLDSIIKQNINVEMVCINGPGDPLSHLESTEKTLELVRAKYPEMLLCITTAGLSGEEHVAMLAEKGVAHANLLVEAVDPEIAKKIYAWIRPGTKTIPLAKAVTLLTSEQKKTVTAFKNAGIKVQICTTIYPGYNDTHVEEIARTMADLGADSMSLTPYKKPIDGECEPSLSEPSIEAMIGLSNIASRYIKIEKKFEEQPSAPLKESSCGGCCSPSPMDHLPKPTKERPNVAVVSSNGMDIDLHLGQAIKALIYGPREDGLACLLGTRFLPEPGGGNTRWETLADTLQDCFVLLAASAGETPKKILSEKGIRIIITDDNVEGTVDVLYGGGKKQKKARNK
ncbi:MAG: radical SAM protein [Desulfobulbaceae bacterium]|nr:radical SAM protein [Desulfobulbaceae bacterium]